MSTFNIYKCNCKKPNPKNWIMTDMYDLNEFKDRTYQICKEHGFDVPPQFHGDDDYLFEGFCTKCGDIWNGDVEYEIALRKELDNWHLGNELILTFKTVE